MSTVRQAMKELLAEQPRSSLELSQLLSQSEKEVLDHLTHLARAPGPGRRFQIIPRCAKTAALCFANGTASPAPAAAPCASTNPSAARASPWWSDKSEPDSALSGN